MRKKKNLKIKCTNGTNSDWLTLHGQGQAPAGFGVVRSSQYGAKWSIILEWNSAKHSNVWM
jgi:hypothetical protein